MRHATGEPYIQLIESTDSIPFDISDLRTIKYGLDVEMAEEARTKIRSQLELLDSGDSEFDNPISRSAEMQSLRESANPADQNLAEILKTISSLDKKVSRLENNMVNEVTKTDREQDEGGKRITIDGQHYAFPDKIATEDSVMFIADETNRPPEDIEDLLTNNR
ncbi:hypothetical protein [Halococcus qingdaonensis]|uniref:hypothetical protein n=1 Tax=Halococcus qingdaonensis TaxID=224402 RepID=UPI002116D594|nr:hypothetical protein [Halococcus qingdaonensis]